MLSDQQKGGFMIQVPEVESDSTAPVAVPVAPPAPDKEVIPLPETLRQIGRDSRKEPQRYLNETTVPFGGE
jgi:hypothetical protein